MGHTSRKSSKKVSAGLAGFFVVVTMGIAYVAIMKAVLDSETPVPVKKKQPVPEMRHAPVEEVAPASTPAPATPSESTEEVDGPVTILWPIRATKLSSRFGYRINPVTHDEQQHRGVDVPAPCGSHVLAIDDGEVVYADYSSIAGIMVKIVHDGGWTTLYMHLARATVKPGTHVTAGQLIGFSGETGVLTTGPHLHFEVWKGNRAINPTAFRYRMPAGPAIEPSPYASCGPRVAVASR